MRGVRGLTQEQRQNTVKIVLIIVAVVVVVGLALGLGLGLGLRKSPAPSSSGHAKAVEAPNPTLRATIAAETKAAFATKPPRDFPIDAVVTWVDGNDDGWRARVAAAGSDLQAYLVRRRTKYSPGVASYVLAIRRVVPWWKREDSDANAQREREVCEAVLKNLSTPCDLRVFIIRRSGLLTRIAKVKGSRLYPV